MKLFFGILSIIPAAFAYYYYFRDVFAGRTKPHAFSWLIWGILATNGFIAQVSAHAGIGSWVTVLTAICNLLIFCLAVFKGDTKPTLFDWAMLALSVTGFAMLFVISNKVIALYITLFALVAGFSMTAIKSYKRPDEETAKSFLLNTIKFIPAIFALSSISFLTLAYPLTATLVNASLVSIIYLRRRSGSMLIK